MFFSFVTWTKTDSVVKLAHLVVRGMLLSVVLCVCSMCSDCPGIHWRLLETRHLLEAGIYSRLGVY